MDLPECAQLFPGVAGPRQTWCRHRPEVRQRDCNIVRFVQCILTLFCAASKRALFLGVLELFSNVPGWSTNYPGLL